MLNFVVIALLLISTISTSGCIQGDKNATQPSITSNVVHKSPTTQESQTRSLNTQHANKVSTKEPSIVRHVPTNIVDFGGERDNNYLFLYFVLVDQNSKTIASDGKVELTIMDDSNATLYSETFDIRTSQFIHNDRTGTFYGWRIPFSNIKKGRSFSGLGTAILTFTTPGGKILRSQFDKLPIPTVPIFFPVNINTFAGVKEGDYIRFYILLEDKNGIIVPSDGHIKLTIFDMANNTLYTDEFDVRISDFVDYEYRMTGKAIGKAYEWRVPFSKIKKGYSITGLGTAFVTFTSPDGKRMHSEYPLLPIPTYSLKELEKMMEQDFNRHAVTVNKSVETSNFKVTIKRAGVFDYAVLGTKQRYFRIDIEVKNTGSKSEYFSPSNMVIIDDQGNQYDYAFIGTLDTLSKIYPGAKKSGYLLFDELPDDVKAVKFIFEMGIFNARTYVIPIQLKK